MTDGLIGGAGNPASRRCLPTVEQVLGHEKLVRGQEIGLSQTWRPRPGKRCDHSRRAQVACALGDWGPSD